MPKPEKCPSNNPKDIEFYVRGWQDGQEELERAVLAWCSDNLVGDYPELQQSLLSAMEHS
jgi:hypothetical protein